jgi:hypothetical protein
LFADAFAVAVPALEVAAVVALEAGCDEDVGVEAELWLAPVEHAASVRPSRAGRMKARRMDI